MKKQKLEIEPYFALLRHHDWYYEMSDSHETFKKGSGTLQVLTELAATHKVYGKMFDDFKAYYFSGEPWGTKKPPMPKLSDYLEVK